MTNDCGFDLQVRYFHILCWLKSDKSLFNQQIKEKESMTKRIFLVSLLASIVMVFSGCMNMPTQPSQITGSYTSGLNYKDFSCKELAAEQASLARRENQLVTAQEQRIKTSKVQAFWWGYGQGDGVEASELANVRGEKEAVRKALDTKGCKQ